MPTHGRRVTALIITLAGLLLPVAAIVVDGAKRWP